MEIGGVLMASPTTLFCYDRHQSIGELCCLRVFPHFWFWIGFDSLEKVRQNLNFQLMDDAFFYPGFNWLQNYR